MKPLPFTSFLAGALLALNLAAQTSNAREVTVQVQNDSGQPIPGATVDCYAPTGDPMGGVYTMEKQQSATTSNDGLAKFTAPSNWVHFVVRKTGMAFGYNSCGLKQDSIAFTLGKPEAIAGVVVDEANKPVADAEVSLARISFADHPNSAWEGGVLTNYLFARTGTDGAFRIERFPAGSSIDLSVKKKGKALVPRSELFPKFDNLMCQAGQQDLKIRVQPGGTVNVKVVAPDKSVITSQVSVTLRAQWHPFPGNPGIDGVFHFEDLETGTYEIRAIFQSKQTPEWVFQPQNVFVASGKTNEVTLNAIKGGILQVAVVSKQGHKPAAGATTYCNGQNYSSEGAADENGVRLVRLAPGKYRVSANKDGAMANNIPVEVKDGETNRVELELVSPRQLSGTVRDTNGAPVVGAEVGMIMFYGLFGSVKTDAAGHYQIQAPQTETPLGSKALFVVRDRPRNLAVMRDIEDGTDAYDLQLAPASTISGRVEDEQGKPVTNAAVTLLVSADRTLCDIDNSPKIDAQGSFEIPALPLGRRYSLSVRAKGYGSASSSTTGELNTNRFSFETITLRLANMKVSGIVIDEQGNPEPGAYVSASNQGQQSTTTTTDETGHFVINNLCDGRVDLNVSSRKNPNAHASEWTEAGDTNVVLKFGQVMSRSQSRRTSLLGKPLPDLAGLGFTPDVPQLKQPVLVCLFDPEQRSSRRVVKLLGDQNEALKQKGVSVIAISAVPTTPDAFKEWKQSNPVPFPTGLVTEKNDKYKWVLEADQLPWLILTDAEGHVRAEGFTLEQLDAKLK